MQPLFVPYSRRLADLCVKHRLPSISDLRQFAQEGGLMSYGPNRTDTWRRTAAYVDRVLKGASPAELPIEEPRQFEFVVNMKTATALGLTLPKSLLLRADEMIE